jgi:DNA-binding transcriptional LysR family regulator
MDRIDAMAVFVAVADLQGFAPAARRLGLSAPAVTRMVAALEERLGARLLQRTTRSVMLTDVGARYLERARRILADVEEAELSAQAERTRPSGRLVVSAPVGFGRIHVTPLMSAYLQLYPDVAGELRLTDRMVNLVEDGVDAAVRIGHLADSSLVARQLGSMRRIVVASPDYLARRGLPKTPDEIVTHDTIQFGVTAAAPEWHFVKDGQNIHVAHAPRFTTNIADAAIWHAEHGGGLTSVLAYLHEAQPAAGFDHLAVDLQPLPDLCGAEEIGRQIDRHQPRAAAKHMAAAQPHRIVGQRRDQPAMRHAARIGVRFGDMQAEDDGCGSRFRIDRLPRCGERALAAVRHEAVRNFEVGHGALKPELPANNRPTKFETAMTRCLKQP